MEFTHSLWLVTQDRRSFLSAEDIYLDPRSSDEARTEARAALALLDERGRIAKEAATIAARGKFDLEQFSMREWAAYGNALALTSDPNPTRQRRARDLVAEIERRMQIIDQRSGKPRPATKAHGARPKGQSAVQAARVNGKEAKCGETGSHSAMGRPPAWQEAWEEARRLSAEPNPGNWVQYGLIGLAVGLLGTTLLVAVYPGLDQPGVGVVAVLGAGVGILISRQENTRKQQAIEKREREIERKRQCEVDKDRA